MTIELKMLAWSIVLGLIHIILTASAGSKQNGLRWNISPRDEARPLQGMAGRLERAQRNGVRSFISGLVPPTCRFTWAPYWCCARWSGPQRPRAS